MKKHWLKLQDKFDKTKKREKMMIAIAAIIVIISFTNFALLEPVKKVKLIAEKELSASLDKINTDEQQIVMLSGSNQSTVTNAHISDLKTEIAAADEKLAKLQPNLIDPNTLPGLLGGLIGDHLKLTIIKMEMLPIVAVVNEDVKVVKTAADKTKEESTEPLKVMIPADPPSQLSSHSIEVTLEGRYADLMEYVTILEKMPLNLQWRKADLVAKQYPINQLTLKLSVLSLDVH